MFVLVTRGSNTRNNTGNTNSTIDQSKVSQIDRTNKVLVQKLEGRPLLFSKVYTFL